MSTEPAIPSPFVVTALPGFTPAIGHLVCMMTYTRNTTLRAVEGLGMDDLDHRLDDDANSIGMLLEHIACLEEAYQLDTFGWEHTDEDAERWRRGVNLGPTAREHVRGHALSHYVERLAHVRARTLEAFARRDDAWLQVSCEWWDGQTANNHFKWFHVFEDELSHRGQIRLLRRRLPRRDG